MNLAIRGIEANLGPNADTFHSDLHPDLKADYILANPPFNISDWAIASSRVPTSAASSSAPSAGTATRPTSKKAPSPPSSNKPSTLAKSSWPDWLPLGAN